MYSRDVVIYCRRASRSIKGPLDDTPQPPIKIQEVKAARTLASEITQGGAKLYDLLSVETKNRQERLQALRFMDQAGASSGSSGDGCVDPYMWSLTSLFML